MTALERWFERQGRRESRVVLLEDALLGGRFGAYFAYRLRYFSLRWAAASIGQLVKVLLLHRLFAGDAFISLVAAGAIVGLASSAWWGALEVLRARVRRLYRTASPARVSSEIARWVVASIVVATAASLAAAAAIVGARLAGGGAPGPFEAALIALVTRGCLDLPLRAYHAGVYAVRRVYRPPAPIIGLEAASVLLLVLLVPWLGAWSVAASEAILALAFAALSLRYVSRAHRAAGLAPHRHLATAARRLRRARGVAATLRALVAPGLAGLLMGVDSLVLLAASAAAAGAPGGTWLALLLAGLAPTIRASFEWGQLLYFDLKRLEAPLFTNLRARFDQAALRLALVAGVVFSIVAVVIAVVVMGLREIHLLGLPPLLIGASLLGAAQVEAFAAGAYRRAALGGVFLVAAAGLATARVLPIDPLVLLVSATWLAAAAVRVTRRRVAGTSGEGSAAVPTAWLAQLAAVPGPVRLGRADLARATVARDDVAGAGTDWRVRQLADRVADLVRIRGAVTWLSPRTVLWFEPAGSWSNQARGRVAESGGPLSAVAGVGPFASGSEAARAALAWDVFPGPVPAASQEPITRTALEARFRSLFPDGIVFAPFAPVPSALSASAPGDRRAVLWEAARFVRSLGTAASRGRYDVSCWCPEAALEVVFLIDRREPRNLRRQWRRVLVVANLGAAIAAGDAAILAAAARGGASAALAAPTATSSRHG